MKNWINYDCRLHRNYCTGRRDIIVVASVSCIYGIGNPKDFENGIIRIKKGQTISRQGFLHSLVNRFIIRTPVEFKRGTFRVKGIRWISTFLMWIMDTGLLFLAMRLKRLKALTLNTGKRIDESG